MQCSLNVFCFCFHLKTLPCPNNIWIAADNNNLEDYIRFKFQQGHNQGEIGPYDAVLSPQTLMLGHDEAVLHWEVFTTLYSSFWSEHTVI